MSKCKCIERLINNHNFIHFNREKNRIGSSFDDFGYNEYIDKNGNIQTVYAHKRLGVHLSYEHVYEDVPKEWKFVKFVLDNSVIPKLKEKLLNLAK